MTIKAQTMLRAAWLYAVLWVAALSVWLNVAFAQDAGLAAAGPAPVANPLPVSLDTAHDILSAAHTHKWGLLIAIAVGALSKVLIWAGRRFDVTSSIGAAVHKVLDIPGASFLIPMIGSVSGMLVTSLSSGAPVDVNGIADAVLIGLAAGGWGSTTKKVQVDEAADAGAAAAAGVVTKDDAIKAIKGPNP